MRMAPIKRDRGFIGEDADDLGAALDPAIQALDRIRAVQLEPVFPRERRVGQHIELCLIHQDCQLGEFRPHLISHGPPLLAGSFRGFPGCRRACPNLRVKGGGACAFASYQLRRLSRLACGSSGLFCIRLVLSA